MTAFPSGSSNNVNTSNLDSASDQPKNARADLLALTQRVNEIINSYDTANGLCALNASGKVDTSKLTGQIGSSQLGTDAVNGTNIEDDSIDSEHIVDGAVDFVHQTFSSTATDLGGNVPSDVLLPTQKASKTYVDAQITSQIATIPEPIYPMGRLKLRVMARDFGGNGGVIFSTVTSNSQARWYAQIDIPAGYKVTHFTAVANSVQLTIYQFTMTSTGFSNYGDANTNNDVATIIWQNYGGNSAGSKTTDITDITGSDTKALLISMKGANSSGSKYCHGYFTLAAV